MATMNTLFNNLSGLSAGVSSTKFTSEQLAIARSIAASRVRSMFPAGGAPTMMSRVSGETLKIAKELFGEKEEKAKPAPEKPAAPTTDPAQELKIAELTEQAKAYRTQAEQQLSAADLRIKELENQELQAQKARDLQQRFAITAAANQTRGAQTANLQIAPASATPMTAGTQSFKRRPRQFMRPIGQTAGKLTVPTSNVLNI